MDRKKNIENKFSVKNMLITLLRVGLITVGNVFLAAVIGTLALFVVYHIPLDRINQNMVKSAAILEKEGTYHSVFSWCQSQLDNWTDSVILLEASDSTQAPVMEQAMMVYRGAINDLSPCDALISHFLDEEPFTNIASYSRYWHGFLVFVKPLLYLMSYSGIRIFNGIMQILLCISICILMRKRKLNNCIVPYILTYFSFMPVVLAMSLQFSSCYYVYSVGMILLLLLPENKREEWIWLIFLNIGILTAFFDFLTYPMVTFGIPAILCVSLQRKEKLGIKLLGIIKNGVFWSIGFGGMWVSKWFAATWLTGNNAFTDAIHSFQIRTSSVSSAGDIQYSVPSCEKINYLTFLKTPVTIAIFLMILWLFFQMIKKKMKISFLCIQLIPFFILSFAPVVWYAFAVNHSMMHYWFTNKSCAITFMAAMFGLACVKGEA